MAKRLLNYSLLILLILLLDGCASKRLTKKAIELDQAGMFIESSELYLQALKSNKNNIDARAGLSRSGQLVLNQKLDQFKSHYNSNNTREAVYAYKEAESYKNRTSGVGVELYFPPEYIQYYSEVEDRYLSDKYNEGMKALDVDDFNGATTIFSEVVKLNGGYKDSKTQLRTAIYEPKYREAIASLNAKRPRTAYLAFDAIEKATGIYKESKTLKQTALERATIYITLSGFTQSRWTLNRFDTELNNKIQGAITEIKLPFYKLINNTSSITQTTDTLNTPTFAVLKGQIISYLPKSEAKKDDKKKCYRATQITVYDSTARANVKKTIYQKTYYTEIKSSSSISASVNYSLLNSKTNQLMVSDAISEQVTSSVVNNYYSGDLSQLVPGYWEDMSKNSNNDRISSSTQEITNFRESFKNILQPTSETDLRNEIAGKIADKIADKIAKYNPEP